MRPQRTYFPRTKEIIRAEERLAQDEADAAALLEDITGIVDDCDICNSPAHRTVDCPQRTAPKVRYSTDSPEETLQREIKAHRLACLMLANGISSEKAATITDQSWDLLASIWNRRERKQGEKKMDPPTDPTRLLAVQKLREIERAEREKG